MSRKITEQEAREWLKKNRPEIELLEWGGSADAVSKFRVTDKDGFCRDHYMRFEVVSRKRRKWISIKWTMVDCVRWLKWSLSSYRLLSHGWGGGSSKKSWFKCAKCGDIKYCSFDNIHSNHRGCRNCINQRFHEERSMSFREAKLWLAMHRPNIQIKKWNGKSGIKSVFVCDCGNEYTTYFSSIKNGGHNCMKCASKLRGLGRRLSEDFLEKWLLLHSPHTILVNGSLNYDTARTFGLFRCLFCGNKWRADIGNILRGRGCPDCNANGKRYRYDGEVFDSSWEIVFYMYWKFCKHKELYRNPQKHGLGYWISYDRGRREFHPDFITANHRLIEIKPENGGKDRKYRAKRRASKKCGRKVYWYGYREINPMKEWLIKHGYDWEQYRVNDKKNKPKVKKQNKSDEFEESCCGKA